MLVFVQESFSTSRRRRKKKFFLLAAQPSQGRLNSVRGALSLSNALVRT
jgi:L-fucose isomerase-like protein